MSVPLYSITIVSKHEGQLVVLLQTLDRYLAEEVRQTVEDYLKKYPAVIEEISLELANQVLKLNDSISNYLGKSVSLDDFTNTEIYSVVTIETALKSRSSIGTKPL